MPVKLSAVCLVAGLDFYLLTYLSSLDVLHYNNDASCCDLHLILVHFIYTTLIIYHTSTSSHITSNMFISLDIFSLNQDLSVVSFPLIYALLTSGLSLILFTTLLLLT